MSAVALFSARPGVPARFAGSNVPDQLTNDKPLVNIESPFSGKSPDERALNVAYARQCMLDSLKRGEAPWVMHLLYPQVLDDDVPEERSMGISAGLAWRRVIDKSVVYIDRGMSTGMAYGLLAAWDTGKAVEARSIQGAPVPDENELKAIVALKYPQILEKFPGLRDRLLEAAKAQPQVASRFPRLAGTLMLLA